MQMTGSHIRFSFATIVFAASLLNGANVARGQDDARSGAELLREGNRLLADGQYAEALAAYERAGEKLPDAPEVAYNRGIALYRLGEYARAESAFQDAMAPGRPALEAAAKYNLGRSAHASALARRGEPEAAIDDLTRAIGFYQDGLELAPEDGDGQRNLDLAERQLAFIRKKMEQMQQQQQPSGEQQQDGDEQQDDEQPQGQQRQASQSEQQPSDEEGSQSQDGPQQNQQDQQGAQPQDGESQRGSEQDEHPPQPGDLPPDESEPPGDAQQPQPGEAGEDADPASTAQGEPLEAKPLTPEQLEGMLQYARDLERQRREAQRARMMRRRGRVPVEKDW